MKKRILKTFLWAGVAMLILMAAGVSLWFGVIRHHVPKELMKDVRAGLAARHVREPNARIKTFLEARYGPMTEPTNRQNAFLGFFDVDHIKGFGLLVSHTPMKERQANTQAMAEWIANYRDSMTPAERTTLQTCLNSEAGRASLRQATAQYQSQDVYFRGAQKQVIAQLMITLGDLRKP